MLGKTDSQANFFDSYVEEHFLSKKHKLLEMREKIDFSFIEKETKDLYAKVAGRPSCPPGMIFEVALCPLVTPKYARSQHIKDLYLLELLRDIIQKGQHL